MVPARRPQPMSRAVALIMPAIASDDSQELEAALCRLGGRGLPSGGWPHPEDGRLEARLDALDRPLTLPVLEAVGTPIEGATALLDWLRQHPWPVTGDDRSAGSIWHPALLLVVLIPLDRGSTLPIGALRALLRELTEQGQTVRVIVMAVSSQAVRHFGRLADGLASLARDLDAAGGVLEGTIVVEGITGPEALTADALAEEAHLVAAYLGRLPVAARVEALGGRDGIRRARARRWADPRLVTLHLAIRQLAAAALDVSLRDRELRESESDPSVLGAALADQARRDIAPDAIQAIVGPQVAATREGLIAPLRTSAPLSLAERAAALDGLRTVQLELEAGHDGLGTTLERAIEETAQRLEADLLSRAAAEVVTGPGRWQRALTLVESAAQGLPPDPDRQHEWPDLLWPADIGARLHTLAPGRATFGAALLLGVLLGSATAGLTLAAGLTELPALAAGLMAAAVPLGVHVGTRVIRALRRRYYLRRLAGHVNHWLGEMLGAAERRGPSRLALAVEAAQRRVESAHHTWTMARDALRGEETQTRLSWLERSLFIQPIGPVAVDEAANDLVAGVDAEAVAEDAVARIAAVTAIPTSDLFSLLPADVAETFVASAREALPDRPAQVVVASLGPAVFTVTPAVLAAIAADAGALGRRSCAWLFAPEAPFLVPPDSETIVSGRAAPEMERGFLALAEPHGPAPIGLLDAWPSREVH